MQFKAVKFANSATPLVIGTQSLPVTEANGQYKLPSEDSILVKVHAAALNPIDLIIKNSLSPWIFRGEKGFGFDYSGVVVAIGSKASQRNGLQVNDRVAGLFQDAMGPGTIAEYVLVDSSKATGANARKLPDNLTFQQGAAYPLVFGTAQTMFDNIAKGNTFNKILIIGAGTSVGRYCVQLGSKVYNASEIVVSCSGKTENTIRELGATTVIDYTKHKSILNPVLESVKESGPFDAIFDCCGNSDLLNDLQSILKSRQEAGSYTTIAGDAKLDFSKGFINSLYSNLTATIRMFRNNLGWLPYNYNMTLVNGAGAWPDKCVKAFKEHNFKVFIDSEYSMDQVTEAVKKLESNKAVGKVIINIE